MARSARNTKKKSTGVRVNFDGVETASVVPEGEYIASVISVKPDESQAGNDYLAWELAITGGKHKGKKLYNNTSLAEQSLWATKRFLENLGVEIPEGEFELELDDYVDMEIGLVVEHETYKGRTRSRVVDTFPAEDGESGGGEKEDEDDGGSEKYTEDQVNEMGKKELKDLVKQHELDVELEGSTSSQRRAVIKALKAEDLIGEEEEEKPKKGKSKKVEDEEDDEKPAKGRKAKKADDEEDEKPKRRGRKAKDEDEENEKPKKGKKSKKVKVAADDVNSMDEEGLTELIETHELDVDLDDHSTMKRKRSAVIDALESADLLED